MTEEEFKNELNLSFELRNLIEEKNLTLNGTMKILIMILCECVIQCDDVEVAKFQVFKKIDSCLRFFKQEILH